MKGRPLFDRNVTEAPCLGCKKRYVGCHGTCKEFKDFRKVVDEHNKEMRKKANTDYMTEAVRRRTARFDKV